MNPHDPCNLTNGQVDFLICLTYVGAMLTAILWVWIDDKRK